MTALDKSRDTQVIAKPSLKGYLVEENTTIYKGGMVCIDDTGYLVPADDDANFSQVVGVADEGVVTGAGEHPMLRVRSGEIYDFAASSITQAMVGTTMYVVDDQTFDDTQGNVIAGVLIEFVSTTRGKIYIPTPGARPSATIGASDIETAAVTEAKLHGDLRTTIARQARVRLQASQVNAGATLVASPGTGRALRLIDLKVIAVGGTTAAGTAVEVRGTQSASPAILASFGIADLDRSALATLADATILADGASFAACDAATAITAIKDGDDFTGVTHFDFIITYGIDAA